MVFPAPNITEGFVSLFQYANIVTGGIFGIGILVIIFFVTYLNISYAENTKAFAVASWVTMLSAIFLRLMNIIPTFVLYLCIFIAIISIIALKGTEKEFG